MDRAIEELQAGDAFRDTLVPRADGQKYGAWLWHGWAIMDAFLAGVDWERNRAAAFDLQPPVRRQNEE